MNDSDTAAREGLAEILGAGTPLRWERPLLFMLAWFTSSLAVLPLVMYGTESEGFQWSLRAPSPWEVVATFLTTLLLALLAFALLKLIPSILVALPLLAVVYSLLARPIYATTLQWQVAGREFPEADSPMFAWFRLDFFVSAAVWYLLFFLGLELGLRLLPNRWQGLLAGAVGGGVLADAGRRICATAFGDSGAWQDMLIWQARSAVEGILLALLLILVLAIAAPRNKEPRVRRGLYLGTLLGAFSLAGIMSLGVIVMTLAELWEGEETVIPMMVLIVIASVLLTYGSIFFMVLVYKMWAAIQDGHARTTPGRALGFLFIPFFNVYWIFPAFWGWARDYNAFIQRKGLQDAPTLAPGLFLAYIALALAGVLPVVGVLLVPVTFVVGLVLVSRICDAVNALPEKVEPAGEIL